MTEKSTHSHQEKKEKSFHVNSRLYGYAENLKLITTDREKIGAVLAYMERQGKQQPDKTRLISRKCRSTQKLKFSFSRGEMVIIAIVRG